MHKNDIGFRRLQLVIRVVIAIVDPESGPGIDVNIAAVRYGNFR